MLQDAMNEMFGTALKITFSPGRSMAAMSAKIRAEAAAGTPATSDIYLGPAAFAIPMVKRKVHIGDIRLSQRAPGNKQDKKDAREDTQIRKIAGAHIGARPARTPHHRRNANRGPLAG